MGKTGLELEPGEPKRKPAKKAAQKKKVGRPLKRNTAAVKK